MQSHEYALALKIEIGSPSVVVIVIIQILDERPMSI